MHLRDLRTGERGEAMSDERRRGQSSTLGGADESIAGADDSIALDLSLEQASSSLESARALLSLRKTVGRNLRVAIRCLLEAQEKIEIAGPSMAARLDLLEAIARPRPSHEDSRKASDGIVSAFLLSLLAFAQSRCALQGR